MALSLGRWLGKVAVVTGANSGIGAAISKRLTQEGITVVGVDKNVERINEASKELAKSNGQLHSFKADLTREGDILDAFKWIKGNVGPLSILINNAGVFFPSSIIQGKTEDWRTVLDVNLLGLCIASREAINIMNEENIDGHIVNISSLAAYKVIRFMQMYPASKFAVRAVTETIRLELLARQSKIKIGCISPGFVSTQLVEDNKALLKAGPLAGVELLKPENIVDAIVYVLSTPPNVQIQDLIIRPLEEPF